MTTTGDHNKFDGEVRTDVNCHECSNVFVALLDFSRDGNHVINCPYCKHEHFRVIKGGKITEDRWSRSYGELEDKEKIGIFPRRVWKNTVLPNYTTSASDFIRQRWLEKGLR